MLQKLFKRPLSHLTESAAHIRNWLFDRQHLKSFAVAVPVISVGNLTLGGTGKSPMVDCIVKGLLSRGRKPAVVSRGYGGKFDGAKKVELNSRLYFGDEPMMLAMKNSQVPIYVGADRVLAIEELLKNEKVDFVVADDAFQHRRLLRKFDIVLIDLCEKIENYKMFPLGRGREPLSSLNRASCIVFSRANMVAKSDREERSQFVLKHLKNSKTKVFYTNYLFKRFHDQQMGEVKITATDKVMLVSAIARPDLFLQTMKEQSLQVVGRAEFADHHHFTKVDLLKIYESMQKLSAQFLVCTEKDWVKLKTLVGPEIQVAVAEMNLEFEGSTDEFFNSFI